MNVGARCVAPRPLNNLLPRPQHTPLGQRPWATPRHVSPFDHTSSACAGDIPSLLALRRAPALQTLCLDLSFNSLGGPDIDALALLAEAPNLHSLDLNLKGTQLVAGTAQPLAFLQRAPGLHTLRLQLANNLLGAIDARALATLRSSPSLRVLHLDLSRNWLGEGGVRMLRALQDGAGQLREVTVDVFANEFRREGAAALATSPEVRAWYTEARSAARRSAHSGGCTGCDLD